jgi:beta-carotene ketolase (CrtW type)
LALVRQILPPLFRLAEFGILTVAVVIYLIILRERFPTMLVFWALPAILSSVQLFYFGTYRPHRIEEETFHRSATGRAVTTSRPLCLC